MLTLEDAVCEIERAAVHPEIGLPDEIFRLVTKLTPMINVDLLIKNEAGKTLLTWRDDSFYSPGWHIPGGIIRFQEPIGHRIHAVAQSELRTDVDFDPAPLKLTEFIQEDLAYRNHFISLLYRCRLTSSIPDVLHCKDFHHPNDGEYEWFSSPPENLLQGHCEYRSFF